MTILRLVWNAKESTRSRHRGMHTGKHLFLCRDDVVFANQFLNTEAAKDTMNVGRDERRSCGSVAIINTIA